MIRNLCCRSCSSEDPTTAYMLLDKQKPILPCCTNGVKMASIYSLVGTFAISLCAVSAIGLGCIAATNFEPETESVCNRYTIIATSVFASAVFSIGCICVSYFAIDSYFQNRVRTQRIQMA